MFLYGKNVAAEPWDLSFKSGGFGNKIIINTEQVEHYYLFPSKFYCLIQSQNDIHLRVVDLKKVFKISVG